METINRTKDSTRTLTGNYYFKPTIFGLVLLVEEIITHSDAYQDRVFRKADYEDLFKLGLIKSRKPKLE